MSANNKLPLCLPPGVEGGQFFGLVAPPQANWIASCSSFSCRVRVHGGSLARVHEDRLGHAVESSSEKSMWIVLRPERFWPQANGCSGVPEDKLLPSFPSQCGSL
jgi:hypothetical protein